jgi:hypothetical protein
LHNQGAKELDLPLLAQRLLKMEARLLITPLPDDTTLLNKHLVGLIIYSPQACS